MNLDRSIFDDLLLEISVSTGFCMGEDANRMLVFDARTSEPL